MSAPIPTPPATDPAPAVPPPAPPVPAPEPPAPPATGDLGDAGKATLAKERADRKAAEKTAKELKDRLDALEDKDKSELEKAQKRLAELEKENADEKAQRLRLQVATKHGISQDDLVLLTGTTEDELTAQAKRIAEIRAGAAAATAPPRFTPNPGQNAGNGKPPATATVAAGAALYAEQKASPNPIWKG